MDKFKHQPPEKISTPKNEDKESFSIEKWKLSHEKSREVLGIVEAAETREQKQTNPERELERSWISLDEQGEALTQTDQQRTESLIREIEEKFPELKRFAADQYC